MTIYKYTLFKYIKSWSTWIILGISLFISSFLGGYVPYRFLNLDSRDSAVFYALAIIGIVGGITVFLSIFVSVFAGFKAAQMFKDEIEDGTFLVVLSKPISRSKIIFFKWLALQTVMIGFTFLTALGFLISTSIFDVGHKVSGLDTWGISTLRSKIFSVSLVMWGVLTLSGLIFSSFALLLSTRLNTGSTIGISIALGVIIPITQMVSLFTKKTEYETTNNRDMEFLRQSLNEVQKGASQSQNPSLTNLIGPIFQSIDKEYNKYVDFSSNNPDGLYSMGLKTGEKDGFGSGWIFDLNFQINQIGSYASDIVVPEIAMDTINSLNFSATAGSGSSRFIFDRDIASDQSDKESRIYKMVEKNTEEIRGLRNQVSNLLFSFSKLYELLPPETTNPFIVPDSIVDELDKYFGTNIDITDASLFVDSNPKDEKKVITNKGISKIFEGIQNTFNNFTTVKNKTGDFIVVDSSNGQPLNASSYKIANVGEWFDLIADDSIIWADAKTSAGAIEFFNSLISQIRKHLNQKVNKNGTDNIFSLITLLESKVLNPLSEMVVKEEKLDSYITEQSINETISAPSVDKKNLKLLLHDAVVYEKLAKINKHDPDSIVKIKSKKYINKNYLLIFYLIIAFMIVPLSYRLIKNKDFR